MTFIDDQWLVTGPAQPQLLLAHGAGAHMDSEFMNQLCELLAEQGVGVVRFEFSYMQQRRQAGSRRPPDRQPKLLERWREVIEHWRREGDKQGGEAQLFIGGKSMGGRMASLLADEQAAAGLVCLGYPFHPQGKPEKTRTEHLKDLTAPTLIVQGTRDPLGNRDDVDGYDLSAAIEFLWLEDGDHDFKPRVRSGFTRQQHLQVTAVAIAGWIQQRL